MQGERSNEEKIALEAKIKDLNDDLDQRNNTHVLLTLQLKRLQVHAKINEFEKKIIEIEIFNLFFINQNEQFWNNLFYFKF